MINLESTYSPRINPADADYPFGSIKDNTSPGANDGTPLSAVWGNDFEGFRQAAMTEAGLTPSGLPDTSQDSQLLAAVKAVASNELRTELESGGSTIAEIAALKSDLADDDGGALVAMKPSGIATAIKRAIQEVIYDQVLNVKWFGALGNWNMGTQTGADDTAAIQAALTHYATLGSRRVGAKRAIRIPAGHYRVSALDSLTGMDFGVDFIGDGENSAYMWFDHTNPDPALLLRLEFTKFKGINFMGSLSDQNGSNSALWKQVGIKAKLDTNYADIDVRFEDCGFYFWQDLVQIYGRGCVFDNCSFGFITNMMNIVASPDTVFPGPNTTNSDKTGMRHYVVRDSRFDVVSRIYKITGTGTQKDHINGILCANNEFTQCDILVDGADATIRRSNIIGNNALYSFATGVVQVKSSASCQLLDNNFAKEFDDSVVPDNSGDCITSLWTATAGINGLLVRGNVAKNLRGAAVSAGAASTDVNISGNYFPAAWTFPESANHYVFYSPVNCVGLIVDCNNFQSGSVSGNYYLWNTAVQTAKNSVFGRNSAPWSWLDPRPSYTPKLLVNGVQSAATATTTYGKFRCDDDYCYVDVILVIDPTETTGNLSISLPPAVTAVAESPTVTSSYGGNGLVARSSGFTSAGNTFAPIQVNPTTQEAELYKQGGMVTARVTAADTTGAISLFVSFKYRH